MRAFRILVAITFVAAAAPPTETDAQPLSGCIPASPVDVLTHRNESFRTGANLKETCLTPENTNGSAFGRLFSLAVDGQIYAQPLIVSGLTIGGRARNVVYVATMKNNVYAFDADGGNDLRPLWHRSLGLPLPVDRIPRDVGASLGKFNIEPVVGITSTPVIDRGTESIFVVAKIAEPADNCKDEVATPTCPVFYRIFALNLFTGETRDAKDVRLPPPDPQKNPCFWDKRIPTSIDAARINLQRTALLWANGRIYLGFGSHQDAPCPNYHGLLIAFDFIGGVLNQRSQQFVVTPGGRKGGIWQAGNGPAADEKGNIYVITGNGTFERDKQYSGNFVKLDSDLSVLDWFAPANVNRLNHDYWDIDLGSSGPVLLPGTDHMVGGGKEGKLYLVQRSRFGGQQQNRWPRDPVNPPVQYFWGARKWSLTWFSWIPFAMATGYHHIHGAPLFWGIPRESGSLDSGMLYIWPERDHLKAFSYINGKFNAKPVAKGPKAGRGMPGGMLSLSANGSKDGIVWASLPLSDDAWIAIVRGSLRAFRAVPDGNRLVPLWNSYCADPDDVFNFAKYVPPTVANGKVYLPTFSDRLIVYGLFSSERARAPSKLANCSLPAAVEHDMEVPSYKKTNKAEEAANPRK
jgi:hypothetical protein